VTLPEAVEAERASAQFQNGVLTVTLPKQHEEGEESTRIDVS
jgi:HSP20 family molecular chaperone IbpA